MKNSENEKESIFSILGKFDNHSVDKVKVIDRMLEQMEKQSKLKVNMLIKQTFCRILNLQMETVSMDQPLSDYGVDSIVFMDLYRHLKSYFNRLEINSDFKDITLQNIADEFGGQIDDEVLRSIDFNNAQEEYRSGSSLLDLGGATRNVNSILSESEINEQREKILNNLKNFSQSELNDRGLIKNDAVFPGYETFDLMIDDRDCIWIFSKTPVFSKQATEELISLQSNIVEKLNFENIKILYYTHYGVHFSLGGDRLLFAESNIHKTDRFQQWFDQLKLSYDITVPEEYPLLVSVCSGTAQGGGFEYLIKSDFQFVLPQVKLGVPEIKSNLYAGMGGLSYLATQIGLARTKLLNITGGLIQAHQAYEMGLVSHLSTNPFRDAYYFCDAIPDIKIAKHINHRLNKEYEKLRNKDVDDWFQVVNSNIEKGYKKIQEDYRVFNSLD